MAGSVRLERDQQVNPVTDLSRFETGFLATNGKFYACEYEGHSDLAYAKGYRDGYEAERNGWIHVGLGVIHEPLIRWLNQKQYDAMFDWVQAKPGRVMPSWADSLLTKS